MSIATRRSGLVALSGSWRALSSAGAQSNPREAGADGSVCWEPGGTGSTSVSLRSSVRRCASAPPRRCCETNRPRSVPNNTRTLLPGTASRSPTRSRLPADRTTPAEQPPTVHRPTRYVLRYRNRTACRSRSRAPAAPPASAEGPRFCPRHINPHMNTEKWESPRPRRGAHAPPHPPQPPGPRRRDRAEHTLVDATRHESRGQVQSREHEPPRARPGDELAELIPAPGATGEVTPRHQHELDEPELHHRIEVARRMPRELPEKARPW